MTGLTSAYFKPDGKELDKELLKLKYVNEAITSTFPLMIETAIYLAWDVTGLFISSKVCSNETKLKLNLKLNFGLFILKILSSKRNLILYF